MRGEDRSGEEETEGRGREEERKGWKRKGRGSRRKGAGERWVGRERTGEEGPGVAGGG